MTAVVQRAVWVLGACQCALWGLLYYGFPVLLLPIGSALKLSQDVVTGAFSLCLLVMAVAAPCVGRCVDRNWGPNVLRAGTVTAILGVLMVAQTHTASELIAAWSLLGLGMAALLYEPAFGLVIRAIADDEERLRALASITIIGGLASTICLPLMAFAVGGWGWRRAELAVAGVVLAVAFLMERFVLPALQSTGPIRRASPGAGRRGQTVPTSFVAVTALFSVGTFASMALTTLLIPLLLARGHSPAVAASTLAMFGVMQLPGRLWILRRGARSIRTLTVTPLLLQALGLGLVAVPSSLAVSVAGVLLFGTGAGLHTLARPWVMQRLYGIGDAGWWNGRVARIQGFSRAAAPVAVALLASAVGSSFAFASLGVALAIPVFFLLPFLASPELDPDRQSDRECPQ